MRRHLVGLLFAAAFAQPAQAQRTNSVPDSAARSAINEFVITVRDMAAWAIVTPAAHIPVGGLLDKAGQVASVVGTEKEAALTPDSVLVAFRQALVNGARRQGSRACGVGYLVRRALPGSAKPVDAVVVEIEYRTGYRANFTFPYTRDESGQPVFSRAIQSAGTLRGFAGNRRGAAEPAPDADVRRDTVVRPSLEERARQIVRAVPYPTFITNDSSGRPQARTVQPLPPDSAWTVWFATNPRTRKVGEIQRDPRVVLHYFDQGTLSYVSLVGRARVVRDRATKDAHWTANWNAFYPDRDTSVVLIVVEAERLEIVSSTLGISGDAATWRPPTVVLPRRKPSPK